MRPCESDEAGVVAVASKGSVSHRSIDEVRIVSMRYGHEAREMW